MDSQWKMVLEICQTIAIIFTLGFSIFQWKKTRKTIIVDNFSKIINTLNNLRTLRITHPELEKALFKSRRNWKDDKIRKHVYGVMMANIFEWSYISHEENLISDNEWNSWQNIWQNVILADPSFALLMYNPEIYTFKLPDAYKIIKQWIDKRYGDYEDLAKQAEDS